MTWYRIGFQNPLSYIWYTKFLPHVFPPSPGRTDTLKIVLGKIFLDQSIFAPWCIIFFNIFMCKFNGKNTAETQKLVQTDFWKILWIDISYWPLLSFCNFRFIPINYQPTVVYIGSMVWTAIMSYMYNRDREDSDPNAIKPE